MTNNTTPQAAARSAAPLALWLVLLAAAGTFGAGWPAASSTQVARSASL